MILDVVFLDIRIGEIQAEIVIGNIINVK